MKKKLCRALLCALCLMQLAVAFAVPASAARPYEDSIMNCKLYDPDGMFDEVDKSTLDETIRKTSSDIDMYVAVKILSEDSPTYSDGEVERMADNLYDELFNVQYGEETDGVLLFLNLSTHYAYISTCGMGQLYYYNGAADDRISAMISNMRSYLQSENYAGAIGCFCGDLTRYKNKGLPKDAYTYDRESGLYYYNKRGQLVSGSRLPFGFGVNWPLIGGIAALVGSLTGLITFLVTRSKYKLVKTLDATNYISNQDTQYYVRDDLFLREHTSKTRIDTDSGRSGGGGGGGSSHMSSGGFSHGGGGGHW